MQRFHISIDAGALPDGSAAPTVVKGLEIGVEDDVPDGGLEVVAIATSLLQCSLADWPSQAHLVERAFDTASRAGAKIVRVFSGLRVEKPEEVFERVVDALQDLADKAARHNLIVGLENHPACNIATGQEMACVLAAIDHSNLQLVWNPASAHEAGEKPFPAGYGFLDVTRIALVHARDFTHHHVDWQGQIDALAGDGYKGFIHLMSPWQKEELVRLRRMIEALTL